MPNEPARMRTKFDRPNVAGMCSGSMLESVVVTSGIKKNAIATPWTMV